MTEVEIGRRVRVTLARELGCPLRRLHDGADLRRDLGADSLDLARIPHALEDEFGVLLTDDDVAFCQTVGTAIDLVRVKLENLVLDRKAPPALKRDHLLQRERTLLSRVGARVPR